MKVDSKRFCKLSAFCINKILMMLPVKDKKAHSHQLYSSDIHVMTVKPGFIDTKMVFGLPNLFWVASPAYAAHKIIEGLKHKKDIIYVPWFWRYIMLIIKAIPEKIFKRLHL
jgi:short-subunit dehydrogenase